MTSPQDKPLPLVLIGAGGHAKVALALVRALGRDVAGVCDPVLAREGIPHWQGLRVIGDDDEALRTLAPQGVELVNGIGQLPQGPHVRRQVHERYVQHGFRFPALVHPAAIVDASAKVGPGAQIMAGAILQADVVVGDASIVNTGAQLDHDCLIGQHVHIAPGAVLCGGVTVGDLSFVGAGATILPTLDIGARCLIAAGAVLARPLSPGEAFRPYPGAAARRNPSA
jgi:sugar O-acyltransferase (sialic acid O-acetyltransferase NeuD family)